MSWADTEMFVLVATSGTKWCLTHGLKISSCFVMHLSCMSLSARANFGKSMASGSSPFGQSLSSSVPVIVVDQHHDQHYDHHLGPKCCYQSSSSLSIIIMVFIVPSS